MTGRDPTEAHRASTPLELLFDHADDGCDPTEALLARPEPAVS
jgi:hypothetical protein